VGTGAPQVLVQILRDRQVPPSRRPILRALWALANRSAGVAQVCHPPVCVGGNAWLTVCCVVQASLDHTGGIVWVGRMVFVQRVGGCLGWTRLPCVWWIFKLTCARG
jgi:hypothetical protein